jgi:dihydroxyacetone kinase-like protein
MDKEKVALWLRIAAEMLHEQKESLTELDKQIGDGDHGINMDRGFQKLVGQLAGAADLAGVLKTASLVLISTVGGAAGPLYGTFFLRAAAACADKEALGAAALAALFRAGLTGVRQRGRAQPGDKTMVDALAPAVEALETAAASGASLREAVRAAADAAARGSQDTIPMVARKGRASYLGPRSAGHLDPGAASTFILMQALLKAVG